MVLHHAEAVRIFVFTSHRNLFSMCFKSFGFSSIAEDLYTDLDKFKTFYRTNKSKGRIIFKRHINLYLRLFFFHRIVTIYYNIWSLRFILLDKKNHNN